MNNEHSTVAIRRCPFCGHNANQIGIDQSSYYARIECVKCGCKTPDFRDEAKARDVWNRRYLEQYETEVLKTDA